MQTLGNKFGRKIMTCLTATEARTKLYRLSDEDWQSIQETLYLSSIPGMRESKQ